ncbi:hypothetical protein [Paenarthrobacter nicotinovorans]|uniref:hypothetical protein n=1 Tax=Paenarthrobacter nicotinovorans TaxID=29320 RepID=UPI001E2FF580|nr:hypothetical protein [Paenarthrobacter nicotinovorans]MBP2394446.1 hypothetical protein [Paenarthrobacter nicotinovorans]UKE99361.1 hypothetical protein LU808_00610 [Paenarthrobacter nicotinovorans]UKF04141.1 hypothetical protein JMY29_00615 [Paenarthrobacter nicotinovorans]
MASARMRGRNWLVRRVERRLGPGLGRLRYVASSRRIYWKALILCLLVGFLFGTIAEFVSPLRSTREAGHFGEPLLFIAASALTGLVLWSMTLLGSFRKLLVFDGGIVAKYSQKSTLLVFPWNAIAPGTLKAVTTADNTDPDRRLVARNKVSLGAGGRNAVVFRARDTFWVFAANEDPAPLVKAIQGAMRDSDTPGAGRPAAGALPAVVLTGPTALD